MFGEVHGVDVSGEMINATRMLLRGQKNAFVYQNNGMDLSVLNDLKFEFAFSYLVFQHIPVVTSWRTTFVRLVADSSPVRSLSVR